MREGSGDLFVISAPSGAGKTTLIRRLLSEADRIHFSVSWTTRPARHGERAGVDYNFVDRDRFEAMKSAGELLESAEVHGQLYGTASSEVDRALGRGEDVLLDLDTQGAASVRKLRPEAILVFILPPGREALRDRLARRGAEEAEELERRLEAADGEFAAVDMYDYLVVNDSLERALRDLQAIIRARRLLRERAPEAVRAILAGFDSTKRTPASDRRIRKA